MKTIDVSLCVLLILNVGVCSAFPGNIAVNTCLSERQLASSVEWEDLPATNLIFEDSFRLRYDAVYFFEGKKSIGIARNGKRQAVIYNGVLHPVSRARKIPGFVASNSEVDPVMAGWGTVTERSGKYLCINFPSGGLGQSGSFQNVRNVLLLQISPAKGAGVLYSAIGRVTYEDQ